MIQQPARALTRFAIGLLLISAVLGGAAADIPPRSVAPDKSVVDDEFIGYLFALVHDDLGIRASGPELMELFPEYLGGEETPMDFIASFERTRHEEVRRVQLEFEEAFRFPAPIDILGHRPVYLSSSGMLRFRERWVRPAGPEGVAQAVVLERELGVFEVDFARWLDFLLGSLVDDVSVEIVLAAEFEGRWYGAMAGYNPDGDVVTAVYDMPRGRFLARPPREVTAFAADQLTAGRARN